MNKLPIMMIAQVLLLFFGMLSCNRNNQSDNRNKPSPVTMKPVVVPGGGLAFPIGVSNYGVGRVDTSFAMGETEMTNGLTVKVLQWAYDKGLFSEVSGAPNEVSSDAVKFGNQILFNLNDPGSYSRINFSKGNFSVDRGYENHPVVLVMISCHGAVMLCNWLTEMEDSGTDNVVYSGFTPERWDTSETVADLTKTGYRLPSRREWECAARWFGRDSRGRTDLVSRGVNGGKEDLTEGYYWYPGDYASGAEAGVFDVEASDRVSVFYLKKRGKFPKESAAVGSKGLSGANGLGVYDMSGNVREWCFDWAPGMKGNPFLFVGGSWSSEPIHLKLGALFNDINCYYEYEDIGFRMCRTL